MKENELPHDFLFVLRYKAPAVFPIVTLESMGCTSFFLRFGQSFQSLTLYFQPLAKELHSIQEIYKYFYFFYSSVYLSFIWAGSTHWDQSPFSRGALQQHKTK